MNPLHLATAFIAPACHSFSNVCDNRLSEIYHADITFIASASIILQLAFMLPLLAFIPADFNLSASTFGVLGIIALLDFFYLFPYYWALRHTDTSIVAGLFSLGKITLPLLAWLTLGEVLQPGQYVGFFVILGAGVMLTFHWQRFRFNLAAWLMLGSSLMLAVAGLAEKSVLNGGTDWFTVVILITAMKTLISITLLMCKPTHTFHLIRTLPRKAAMFMGGEALLSSLGSAGGTLALSLLPITVVKGLAGSQPLFVLAYATAFKRMAPNLFKENFSGISTQRKILAFVLIILGTLLTLAE